MRALVSPVCTAASLHLLAAVPNVAWLETRVPEYHGSEREQYEAELFPDAPRLDGTTFPTPDRPGLGITFNEDAVRETEFRYWESPHLRRPDGSFTNFLVDNNILTQKDTGGSIGRRYARADEIGVPYCITIDFETLKDDTVTIRERDTTKQKRVKITDLLKEI